MKYDVCVVGPRTLVGESLLEILEERAFPVRTLYCVDHGEGVAETVTFAGRDVSVGDIADFDFARVTLAFFCGDAALSREYAAQAARQGCLVIDASDAHRLDPDVPLAVPEINTGMLASLPPRGIVASPAASAILAALTLKPLADAFGLEGVTVVTLQSVSGTGRAAVEELAGQATALFNQQKLEASVYTKQIAFNLLPHIGASRDDGYTSEEWQIAAQTRRLLALPDLEIDVTAIRVPVFFGHALVAQVRTRRSVAREAVRGLMDAAPGVVVYDTPEPGGYPTPVVEAAGNDPVFVGRIRVPQESAKALSFWAVVDNMRKGSALNCVQIAEKLLQI